MLSTWVESAHTRALIHPNLLIVRRARCSPFPTTRVSLVWHRYRVDVLAKKNGHDELGQLLVDHGMCLV